MILGRLVTSAARVLRREGLAAAVVRAVRHVRRRREYSRWVRRCGSPTEAARAGVRARIAIIREAPLVSIVMPVYETPPEWLTAAVGSVRRQLYPNWELSIADDNSAAPHVRELLQGFAAADPRIRVGFRPRRGHISEASNTALAAATGPLVALLDHDDEISEDALFHAVQAFEGDRDVAIVYSDEDKLDPRGRRVGAYFKPDWNPDLLLAQNVISHLGVYRTQTVRDVGGFRPGFEGSQDYDLALRVVAARPGAVRHVPRVLYHWRMTAGSAALDSGEKEYAGRAAVKALQSYLDRVSPGAVAEFGVPPFYRVRYPLPQGGRVRIVRHGGGTGAGDDSAAALNEAAAEAAGDDVLVFLRAGLVPADGALDELVAQACRPEVGVAGGRIVDHDARVVHGGYLISLGEAPAIVSAHAGFRRDDPGYWGRNQLVQNFVAVSVAAMAVRREVFQEAGGFDATTFPMRFADVDLCLRVREQGRRVVWTPHAEFAQPATPRRRPPRPEEDSRALAAMRARWGDRYPRDPFLHPLLAPDTGDFSMQSPERLTAAGLCGSSGEGAFRW